MSVQVDVDEAQTHLAQLLTRVAAGEEITLCQSGEPVARLVPCRRKRANRVPGLDRGLVKIADDFDAPLDAETWSVTPR